MIDYIPFKTKMRDRNYTYTISVQTRIDKVTGDYTHRVNESQDGEMPLVLNDRIEVIKNYNENLLKKNRGRRILWTKLEICTLLGDDD